jgi:hypothetical protein
MPLSLVAVLAGFFFSLGADALTLPARALAASAPKRDEILPKSIPQVADGEKVTFTNDVFGVFDMISAIAPTSGALGYTPGSAGDEISRDLVRFVAPKRCFVQTLVPHSMCHEVVFGTFVPALMPHRPSVLGRFGQIAPSRVCLSLWLQVPAPHLSHIKQPCVMCAAFGPRRLLRRRRTAMVFTA